VPVFGFCEPFREGRPCGLKPSPLPTGEGVGLESAWADVVSPAGAPVSSQGRKPLVTVPGGSTSPRRGGRTSLSAEFCRPGPGSSLCEPPVPRGLRPWLLTSAPLGQASAALRYSHWLDVCKGEGWSPRLFICSSLLVRESRLPWTPLRGVQGRRDSRTSELTPARRRCHTGSGTRMWAG